MIFEYIDCVMINWGKQVRRKERNEERMKEVRKK